MNAAKRYVRNAKTQKSRAMELRFGDLCRAVEYLIIYLEKREKPKTVKLVGG